MSAKRSTFSMNMTETQKELLDIIAFYESKGHGGRSGAIVFLIRDYIKRFLDLPSNFSGDNFEFDDETLLKYAAKQYNFDLELYRQDEEALVEMFKKREEEHRKLMGMKEGESNE